MGRSLKKNPEFPRLTAAHTKMSSQLLGRPFTATGPLQKKSTQILAAINMSVQSGPARNRTSKNLAEQQRKEGEAVALHRWEPPAATVNEKLNQMRVFLSDEDINQDRDFEKHHKAVEKFLRKILDDKVECDVMLYNRVREMLQVHQSRMDSQHYQSCINARIVPIAPFSRRLALDASRASILGVPLREDRPPFTIERPIDQSLFLDQLHGRTSRGEELQKIESQGHSEVLTNLTTIKDALDENGLPNQEDIFNVRARKRGRQRAAIELALRSFASNHEQNYVGGWQYNFVRLPPKPQPRRPKSVLSIGTKITGREEQSRPRFSWIVRYNVFQERQKQAGNTDAGALSLQNFVRPLNGGELVTTHAQALRLVEDAVLNELSQEQPDLPVDYFPPGRWKPPPAETPSSPAKRPAAKAPTSEPVAKRAHSAVLYAPLGDPNDPPSRRLPPEQLGFT